MCQDLPKYYFNIVAFFSTPSVAPPLTEEEMALGRSLPSPRQEPGPYELDEGPARRTKAVAAPIFVRSDATGNIPHNFHL